MPNVRTGTVTIPDDLAHRYRENTVLLDALNEKRKVALENAREVQACSSKSEGAWKNLHEIERRQSEVATQVKRDADAILACVA